MLLNINKRLTIERNVSRETEKLFREYYETLIQWNESISLIKTPNWEEFYQRHIDDGLFLDACLIKKSAITDIGSGGGIPGIIMSILGHKVTLVESCRKKCIFLNHVIKALSLESTVLEKRIEDISIDSSRIITARALTSLLNLIKYMDTIGHNATGFFLKGEKLKEEIIQAERIFNFSYDIYRKNTESGYIIKIWGVQKKSKACV